MCRSLECARVHCFYPQAVLRVFVCASKGVRAWSEAACVGVWRWGAEGGGWGGGAWSEAALATSSSTTASLTAK